MGAVEYEQHHDNGKTDSTTTSNDTLDKVMKFCEQYGIRYKAIIEARKLRKQLINTGMFVLIFNVEFRGDFNQTVF